VGSGFAARCHDRLVENDDSPESLQRFTERNLLARKQRFVEPARRHERVARAEHVAPRSPAVPSHDEGGNRKDAVKVQWETSFHAHRRAAADRAAVERVQRGPNDRLRDRGVGVDEDEAIAARDACAGIPCTGDLPVFDAFHARARGGRDLRGAIRGGIVHDDHLVRFRNAPRRGADGAQRLANELLFVVRGDDERNHPRRYSLRSAARGAMPDARLAGT
jgi:hypothetical protein